LAVSDSIRETMVEKGWTHQQLADELNYERSYITKILAGNRQLPETADPKLSKWSYKMALKIAHERTDGFIPDILKLIPNMDLHPASLKEVLLKDLHEAITALEGLHTAKHISFERRTHSAEKAWHETKDVVEKAIVLLGVLEEEFGLNRERLTREHDHQVRNGER
jgi:transcriptional regulator with XRE-family HTH domain